MYVDEKDLTNQYDDVLHVFGRTNGNTRTYYYRRFEGGAWTPWEKVGLTLEGDSVFPIIWKSRLFLFWLNFVEKAIQPADTTESPKDVSTDGWGDQVKKNVEINVCWGEYYKGKWTSPKSSDLKEPVLIENLSSFDSRNVIMYGRKDQPDVTKSEHLIFYLFYIPDDGGINVARSVTFTSKNCPPIIDDIDVNDNLVKNVALFNYELYRKNYEGSTPSRLNSTTLKMPGRDLKLLIDQPALAATPTVSETVLSKKGTMFNGFRILSLRHPVQNQWQAPFAYHDEQSVFMVQPAEKDILPIWGYQGYYGGVSAAPSYTVYIPPMVEKPSYIPNNPGYPDPTQPVMDTSGWQQAMNTINTNYKVVLPSVAGFGFDQATFGIGGTKTSINAAPIAEKQINEQ